jgi:hypothetical protein
MPHDGLSFKGAKYEQQLHEGDLSNSPFVINKGTVK